MGQPLLSICEQIHCGEEFSSAMKKSTQTSDEQGENRKQWCGCLVGQLVISIFFPPLCGVDVNTVEQVGLRTHQLEPLTLWSASCTITSDPPPTTTPEHKAAKKCGNVLTECIKYKQWDREMKQRDWESDRLLYTDRQSGFFTCVSALRTLILWVDTKRSTSVEERSSPPAPCHQGDE